MSSPATTRRYSSGNMASQADALLKHQGESSSGQHDKVYALDLYSDFQTSRLLLETQAA